MNFQGVSLAMALAGALPAAQDAKPLAVQARSIFNLQCKGCHGPGNVLRANLNLLDHAQLVSPERRLVVARKPDESLLLQLVDGGCMPPGRAPKLSDKDRKVLRDWILDGAAPFPTRSSEPDILTWIQKDLATRPAAELPLVRYLSLNHLLDDDDAADPLPAHRAALTKALNLLSTKPDVVVPEAIDTDKTIFRIRIDQLGWDFKPYGEDSDRKANDVDPRLINLYDLIILEYPFAGSAEAAAQGRLAIESYLKEAKLLRPVPYVRGDWLIAVATNAPLYPDLLMQPRSFGDLEKRIGVENNKRTRAGLTDSEYLRTNRILERGSTDKMVYWRTYDLEGEKGLANLINVAVNEPPDHRSGEAVYSLDNGLPAFYIADGKEHRSNAIAKGLVVDGLGAASIANGRSCLRCHSDGLKTFADVVLKNVGMSNDKDQLKALYKPLDEALRMDNKRFGDAFHKLPGQLPGPEVLDFVADQYAKKSGKVPPPLDSADLTTNSEPPDAGIKLEVTTFLGFKEANQFKIGDVVTVTVANAGTVPFTYELVLTSVSGKKVKVPAEDNYKTLQPSKKNPVNSLPLSGDLGFESMTIYAMADANFPHGVVCKAAIGSGVADRFIHPPQLDPNRVVKKTVTWEVRAK